MSLRTVEISVPQNVPSVVSIDGGIGPKVVEINQGPAGPNTLSTATTTALNGILKGNGANVTTATAGTDYLTPTGDGSGLTGLVSAQITDASSSGIPSKLVTTDINGSIEFFEENGHIRTEGTYGTIETWGDNASIATLGASAHIQTSTTFKLSDGTHTTTLSHAPTAARSIAFPDSSGTVALTTSNVATATALQTARAIYGNNFDGTSALTQVIASTYGGTGNGFAKFSGPATTEKTFTLPNASATILTDNAAVTVAQGGTGRATSTTAYGLIAAGTTATGAQQTLAAGATTEILVGGGASALPVWTTATGSGSPVRATSPTLATPTIAQINGSTASGGTLTLQSTTNATKGKLLFGTSAYDEVNNRLGIGTTTPSEMVHVRASSARMRIEATSADPVLEMTGTSGSSYLFTRAGSWHVRTDSLTRHVYLQVGDTITSQGNVQIGNGSATSTTPTPASQLVVRSNPNSSTAGLIDAQNYAGTSVFSVRADGLAVFGGNQIGIATSQTPASASAAGTAGTICWDSNYIYICTATNTWKRVAIATW